MSLVFASGKRPSANDVERFLSSPDNPDDGAIVSFRPADDDEGLLEILISGLTFDLCGLQPGRSMPAPPSTHMFGLLPEVLAPEPETVMLLPSHHISGGFAVIPIVQAMIGLAARIAIPLAARAVCWHPARSWMEPQYFSRIAHSWLSGGPFPALGLTALVDAPRKITSEGLDFFVGQELQVDRREGETTAQTAKLAVRIIDHVMCNGRFTEEVGFEGPDGEALHVELSNAGTLATVKRRQ